MPKNNYKPKKSLNDIFGDLSKVDEKKSNVIDVNIDELNDEQIKGTGILTDSDEAKASQKRKKAAIDNMFARILATQKSALTQAQIDEEFERVTREAFGDNQPSSSSQNGDNQPSSNSQNGVGNSLESNKCPSECIKYIDQVLAEKIRNVLQENGKDPVRPVVNATVITPGQNINNLKSRKSKNKDAVAKAMGQNIDNFNPDIPLVPAYPYFTPTPKKSSKSGTSKKNSKTPKKKSDASYNKIRKEALEKNFMTFTVNNIIYRRKSPDSKVFRPEKL